MNTAFFNNTPIRNKDAFETRLQQGRAELVTTANDLCRPLENALEMHRELKKQIKKATKTNWLTSIQDIQSQLEHLIYEDFIYFTPIEYLNYYPRYIKGIQQRLDKLQQNVERDKQTTKLIAPYWDKMIEHNDELYEHPVFELYRWMLEEFRISLFAQNLKTQMPISEKRLEKQWNEVKRILK